jgi:predicted phage-related endonuclease
MSGIYQNTPAWYAERRTGYGASDAPILIEGNEADWRQLHGEKLGLLPDREGSETMELGKRLEDVIARIGAEREGWRLARVNRIVRHPELHHVFASLDRRLVGGTRRPVEVKKWAYKGDDWGPAGGDVVPVRILYQLQQQAAVTGADAIEVIVLFGGAKVERFTVGRDGAMIDEILELETAAWAYVERGEMPPWPGQAPRRIVLATDEIVADDTILNLVEIHEEANLAVKEAEQVLRDAKDRLRATLADVGAAKGVDALGRRVSISHRPSEPSTTTDWRLVAQAYRKWIEDLDAALDPSPSGPRPTPTVPRPDLDRIIDDFTSTNKPRRDLRVTVGTEPRNAAA